MVFFIITDEKWYKIWFENNQIIFEKIEKESDLAEVQFDPYAVYKNADWIHINYEFENPRNLRKSDWMSSEYLAKIEQEKKLKDEKIRNLEKPWIVSLSDNDSISSVFHWQAQNSIWIEQKTWTTKQEINQKTWTTKQEINQKTWTTKQEIEQKTWTTKQEIKQKTWTTKQKIEQKTWTTKQEIKQKTWTTKQEINQSTWTKKEEARWNTEKNSNSKNESWSITKIEESKPVIVYYPVKKYEYSNHSMNLKRWSEIMKIKVRKYSWRKILTLNIVKGKLPEPKILYKNSHKIQIYSWFENPIVLRNSVGIDEEFLLKQKNNNPTIISLNESETISSARQNNTEKLDNIYDNEDDLERNKQNWNLNLEKNLKEEYTWINNSELNVFEKNVEKTWDEVEWNKATNNKIMYNVDKYEYTDHENGMKKWKESEIVLVKIDEYKHVNHSLDIKKSAEIKNIALDNETQRNYLTIDRPEISKHLLNVSEWILPEISLVTIDKYQFDKHLSYFKKWKITEYDFIVENTQAVEQTEIWLSNEMLDNLLENEEIDINTLESENDEFLQKVFEQTKDRDVMNLIVETYLNEYQFVKAKNFIENLPDMYREELKPSLNLRVAFNSFQLSSKTINENLTQIVQDYSSKNEITTEDKNRYLWVIALMDRKYDHFFEISTWFTSEKNISFTTKLQWYKEQISKQMWMPDYYFDTLVSLELFNQWLFQPAKVLALYSLQQNSDYILPYQVLAYANFLTNSRDTSTEYLKKLMDIDPNNADKYRFLMWVAFYRDERYEQSVVMLSMIKDENLRLDTQRYLINNYIKLDQKNKLISSWNKMLWYENLVASDFYTYFYEAFFHPYSEWAQFQLYAYDTELANKMLRVCSITLQNEEKAVCTYGTIGRNIAMWQFNGLEQYLLNLATEYPQWYLYQALWDYYIQQWDLEKAKAYLIKAISLTQKKSERSQIKKLLQDTM